MTFTDSEKADAELVGHIIILAITIIGISMIALVGVPAIYTFQDMATVRNAEQTYTMLDSLASKVALGEATVQSIDIDLKGGSVSLIPNSSSQPSYILFELKNGSNTTSMSVPMGKILYRLGERDVAYEGGGVWTKYPSGSVMLSPPEFNFNGVTLTFPIVNVSGNFSAGGKGTASLKIEKKNSTNNAKIIYPTAAYQNPLDQNITKVSITIKSEYYDAWADFFRSKSLLLVNTYPSEKKVVMTLNAPPLFTNFSYGALASKEIELDNNAETDGYNSSKGKYTTSKTGNGSIRATENIQIGHGAIVNGSAMTAGVITGYGTITKNANAASFGGVTVLGTRYPPVSGLSMGSTINLVQNKISDYKISNDNNNTTSAGSCLVGAGKTLLDGTGWGVNCTISRGSNGSYYLTKFDLSNNKILIFDTTSGSINIALDSSDFKLGNGVNITVNGNNPVKLYMNRNILLSNNVLINPTTNDNSKLFQIVSSSSQDINIENNAEYRGFIWAPEAKVVIRNNGQVYGAIVGKNFVLNNNQKMHYDEALQNMNTELSTGEIITYLYITQNEMVVRME